MFKKLKELKEKIRELRSQNQFFNIIISIFLIGIVISLIAFIITLLDGRYSGKWTFAAEHLAAAGQVGSYVAALAGILVAISALLAYIDVESEKSQVKKGIAVNTKVASFAAIEKLDNALYSAGTTFTLCTDSDLTGILNGSIKPLQDSKTTLIQDVRKILVEDLDKIQKILSSTSDEIQKKSEVQKIQDEASLKILNLLNEIDYFNLAKEIAELQIEALKNVINIFLQKLPEADKKIADIWTKTASDILDLLQKDTEDQKKTKGKNLKSLQQINKQIVRPDTLVGVESPLNRNAYKVLKEALSEFRNTAAFGKMDSTPSTKVIRMLNFVEIELERVGEKENEGILGYKGSVPGFLLFDLLYLHYTLIKSDSEDNKDNEECEKMKTAFSENKEKIKTISEQAQKKIEEIKERIKHLPEKSQKKFNDSFEALFLAEAKKQDLQPIRTIVQSIIDGEGKGEGEQTLPRTGFEFLEAMILLDEKWEDFLTIVKLVVAPPLVDFLENVKLEVEAHEAAMKEQNSQS